MPAQQKLSLLNIFPNTSILCCSAAGDVLSVLINVTLSKSYLGTGRYAPNIALFFFLYQEFDISNCMKNGSDCYRRNYYEFVIIN